MCCWSQWGEKTVITKLLNIAIPVGFSLQRERQLWNPTCSLQEQVWMNMNMILVFLSAGCTLSSVEDYSHLRSKVCVCFSTIIPATIPYQKHTFRIVWFVTLASIYLVQQNLPLVLLVDLSSILFNRWNFTLDVC